MSAPSWLFGGVLLAYIVSIANHLFEGNRNANTAYNLRTRSIACPRGLIRSIMTFVALIPQAGVVLYDNT